MNRENDKTNTTTKITNTHKEKQNTESEEHLKLIREIKKLQKEVKYQHWRKERLLEQLEKRNTSPSPKQKVSEWQNKHFKTKEEEKQKGNKKQKK